MITALSLVSGFDKGDMERLSRWVRLRNIISHEYLDIRWSSIKKFISGSKPLYDKFLNKVKGYLEKKTRKDEEETNVPEPPPYFLGGIFCGITYNTFPNHIKDFIKYFHIMNRFSVFLVFDINNPLARH